jgi:hypothetical protein
VAIVSVTILPLMATLAIVRAPPPAVTVKAVGSGAAPASASEKTTVTVPPFTDVETTFGATVSGVLFVTGDGPKLAVSFFVGAAPSRSRSPLDAGCEYRTVTTSPLSGDVARSSVTVEPETEMPVGAGCTTPS